MNKNNLFKDLIFFILNCTVNLKTIKTFDQINPPTFLLFHIKIFDIEKVNGIYLK